MKPKKYIVIPILLFVYAAVMTILFGTRLLKTGHYAKFWVSVVAELIILVCIFFALRQKEKIKDKWGNLH